MWPPTRFFSGDHGMATLAGGTYRPALCTCPILLLPIKAPSNSPSGKKVRIKANPTDTVGEFKKLVAAQTGTRFEKIVLKKWYTIFKDNVTLADYEIHDGAALELYYQ